MKYRGKCEIILEALSAVESGLHQKTWIAYSAGLNPATNRKYLELLEENGLINIQKLRSRYHITLTMRGQEALQLLRQLKTYGVV